MTATRIHVKMEDNARTKYTVTRAHVWTDTKATTAKQASNFTLYQAIPASLLVAKIIRQYREMIVSCYNRL